MLTLIPIHNLSPYALASLTNLTLGSFFIASHFYQSWLRKFNLTLLDTNALIKAMLVILGFTIISPEKIFSGTFSFQLACLVAGFFIGISYYRFEAWVLKLLPQKAAIQSALIPRKSNNIKNLLNKKITPVIKSHNHVSYLSGGMAGAFEEILFRGFLTLICLSLPNFIMSICCFLLINIVFALSHINLGFQHVLTKFVLGGICLISFLLSGNICMAIATHFTFNMLAIKRIRKLYYD